MLTKLEKLKLLKSGTVLLKGKGHSIVMNIGTNPTAYEVWNIYSFCQANGLEAYVGPDTDLYYYYKELAYKEEN